MKKKGVSPLIASVLLIAFVILLFILISTWVKRSAIQPSVESTEGKTSTALESLIPLIEIKNAVVTSKTLNSGGKIALTIQNIGESTITGLKYKIIGENNEEEIIKIISEPGLKEFESVTQTISISKDLGRLEKIEVYPEIKKDVYSSNKAYVKSNEVDVSADVGSICIDQKQEEGIGNSAIFMRSENNIFYQSFTPQKPNLMGIEIYPRFDYQYIRIGISKEKDIYNKIAESALSNIKGNKWALFEFNNVKLNPGSKYYIFLIDTQTIYLGVELDINQDEPYQNGNAGYYIPPFDIYYDFGSPTDIAFRTYYC